MPAAFISAGIFALAHGYGLIGFLSVFWSGLIWAWIYERTGSLLPGMIAHAVNNLLVCLSVIALLR
jgi:membrane protease YdiL (CAAX protease family)